MAISELELFAIADIIILLAIFLLIHLYYKLQNRIDDILMERKVIKDERKTRYN